MMFKASLFERLSPSEYKIGNTLEDYYETIANNLSRIFSTNAGSAQILSDYGRPDLNNINLSMKDSIEKLEVDCERCINKYEPRLFKAKVTIDKESLKMNKMDIIIDAFLKVSNHNMEHIIFKANLLSNGKTKIYRDNQK